MPSVDEDLRHRRAAGAFAHLALAFEVLGDVDGRVIDTPGVEQPQGAAAVRAPGLEVDLCVFHGLVPAMWSMGTHDLLIG